MADGSGAHAPGAMTADELLRHENHLLREKVKQLEIEREERERVLRELRGVLDSLGKPR